MPDPTPTPAPAPAPAGDTTWYSGLNLDSGLVAHIQTKGWDKGDLKNIAHQAVLSHFNAEKIIGVPQNELVRIPGGNDFKAVYEKLGVPTDPTKYEFGGVKFKNEGGADVDLTPELTDFFRKVSSDLKLTPNGAKQLAQEVMKRADAAVTKAVADQTAALQTEQGKLRTNWGPNYDLNLATARKAAQALGVDAETMNTIEKAVGYSKVMEMFRTIGSKMGEDTFVNSNGPGGNGNGPSNGIMSKDQAAARRSELMKDQAWVDRYLKGDAAAGREMQNLNVILNPSVPSTIPGWGGGGR